MLKKKLSDQYNPERLFLEGHNYSVWLENKEEYSEESVDLSDILPLEGDEEEVWEEKEMNF